MRPSRDRHWGHPRTIRLIERLAATARQNGWAGLYVGDISQARGGPMDGGHRSHQTGLDVDIWLRRADRMDLTWAERDQISSTVVVAADGRTVTADWTRAHHEIIKAAALDPAVARVFVNPAIKRALCLGETATSAGGRDWLGKVRPWTGHDAHFHVRLACPADDPSCVEQGGVEPGDGCGAELERWFSDEALVEVASATRGVIPAELKLGDLPAACQAIAAAGGATVATTSQDVLLRPQEPISQLVKAMYGIQGSRYLWVLPADAGNDGESGLSLTVEGQMPPGLGLERGLNGRGIIRGTPTAPGEYEFTVVGSGPSGVSARYLISLTVEPQRTATASASAGISSVGASVDQVRSFLQDFSGGSCFFAQAVRVIDTLSEIEAFGTEVAAMHRLDAAFTQDLGFEPRIGGRVVAPPHCAALAFVRDLARSGAPAPSILLDDAIVGARDFVSGTVEIPQGKSGALFLVDVAGGIDLVAEGLQGLKRFNRQTLGATGPNLLVALSLPPGQALPRPGLSIGGAYFKALETIAAVRDGRAGVAIRYFVVN